MKFGSSALCLLLAAASPFVALSQGNLYEELETQGFNSFQALVDADVTNTTRDLLEGMIPITLLAPTDAAVGLIADEILDWYMRPEEAGALIYRLTQVMIPGGAFDFDTVKNLDTVTALNLTMTNPMAPGPITYPVIFNSTSNELAVGVGKVIDSLKDLPATNGLIHGMDRMISIPTVLEQLGFDQIFEQVLLRLNSSPPGKLLLARLGAGDITIFAPSATDFVGLLTGGGGGAFGSLLQGMFLNANFGVHFALLLGAHIIDDIFFLDPRPDGVMDGDMVKNLNDGDLTFGVETFPPPAMAPPMTPPRKEFSVSPGVTLVNGQPVFESIDVSQANIALQDGVIHSISGLIGAPFLAVNVLQLAAASGYTRFVELVGEAGLTSDFDQFGITLFVPTNAALEDVSGDQGDILKSFAVFTGGATPNIYPSYALTSTDYETLYTTEATVVVGSGSVTFNGATVIGTDLPANNGIVHVIDSYATGPEGDDDDDDDSSAASKSLLVAAMAMALALFM